MASSRTQANGGRRSRAWFRRGHRWLGSLLVAFVVVFAVSGIALNHASDFGLDRHHVQWSWLLSAYGIDAPEPAASFAVDGHRATLLGGQLYYNGAAVAEDVAALTGMAALGPLVLIGSRSRAFVLTTDGAFVEAIDVGTELPNGIERVGKAGDVAVVESAGSLFRSDAEVTTFAAWEGDAPHKVSWSESSRPEPDQLEALREAYRGEGLTVERVLLDLHSGRILPKVGPLIMDIVAICMVILSLSGLLLSLQRGRRENGRRR
jgi:uncharacterized iron-regulated membrane protein